MALVIEAQPGLATSNTYATLAEAEAYVLTLPVATDWTAATDPQKNAALVQATRMMDTLDWSGWRKNPTVQALQWPRQAVQDREGYYVVDSTIPAKIRDACCEFAVRLIADDRASDAGGLAPETVKVGSLDLGRMVRRPIPASVLEMCREFLAGTGSGPRTVRG